MTEPSVQTPRARPAAQAKALRRTVLKVAAAAALGAGLIWSALFADLVHQRGHAAASTPPTRPTGQLSGASSGQVTQTPAPVTTRTS